MEFKAHAELLGRSKKFILSFTIILTVLAAVVGYYIPTQSKASVAFTIIRNSRKVTDDFQYDDYYALQAAEIFGQNIIGWFLTPAFVNEIYTQAGQPANITSLDRLGARFKAKQLSPQLVVVTFTAANSADALTLANAVGQLVSASADQLDQSAQTDTFRVESGETIIVDSKIPPYLLIISGFVLGLLLSLILVYLRQYLKAE